MRIFLLNPFIVLLSLYVQSCFRGTSFVALVFLLRWVSLLGKLRGGSPNPRSTQKEGVEHS